MGPLTPILGLRLLALAAGFRHNAEIGQPGLCFSAYGHKFGINQAEMDADVKWALAVSGCCCLGHGGGGVLGVGRPARRQRRLSL